MAQSTKQYFKDFFEESDKINDSFQVTDSKGTVHIFDKNQVLQEILSMPNSIQKKIRNRFIYIDYKDGDINNFIEYILKGLVK
jgi:hypothetical protein